MISVNLSQWTDVRLHRCSAGIGGYDHDVVRRYFFTSDSPHIVTCKVDNRIASIPHSGRLIWPSQRTSRSGFSKTAAICTLWSWWQQLSESSDWFSPSFKSLEKIPRFQKRQSDCLRNDPVRYATSLSPSLTHTSRVCFFPFPSYLFHQ